MFAKSKRQMMLYSILLVLLVNTLTFSSSYIHAIPTTVAHHKGPTPATTGKNNGQSSNGTNNNGNGTTVTCPTNDLDNCLANANSGNDNQTNNNTGKLTHHPGENPACPKGGVAGNKTGCGL